MILYQLRCEKEHEFEAWFKDSQACETQMRRNLLECPICGNSKISKAMMAPRLKGTDKKDAITAPMAVMADPVREKLRDLRRAIEENCEHVGDKFAEEARRIHYGEKESRGIYGQATEEEHDALKEEGIETARIPWIPTSDA